MSVIFQETQSLKNQSFSPTILEKRDCPDNMTCFDFGSSIATRHKEEANV